MALDDKFVEECTGSCDWDGLILNRFLEIVPENSIVADIGANVGTFTFQIEKNKRFEEIYAVEVDKDNFNILRSKSSSDSNVRLINVAITDYVGTANIYEGTGTCETRNILGNESLQENFNMKHIKKGEVKCATLDHVFLDKLNTQIDACKIDIEGAEALALKGAMSLIKNMKCLFIECHNPTTYKEILNMAFDNKWTVQCLKNRYTIKDINDLDFCYQIIVFPDYSKFSG